MSQATSGSRLPRGPGNGQVILYERPSRQQGGRFHAAEGQTTLPKLITDLYASDRDCASPEAYGPSGRIVGFSEYSGENASY